MVSVSRVYVPNHYRVFLSPQDRDQFSSYEPALRKELSDYLLEHARQERLALTSRPQIEFHTDERLVLGEFGIQAQLLGEPEAEEEAAAPERRARGAGEPSISSAPSAGDFGHTMVYSPDREARPLEPALDRSQALLVAEGRRNVLRGERVLVGRSRECDVTVSDPKWRVAISSCAAARRAGPRRPRLHNGMKSQRRRIGHAELQPRRSHHDRVTDSPSSSSSRWTSRLQSPSSSAS